MEKYRQVNERERRAPSKRLPVCNVRSCVVLCRVLCRNNKNPLTKSVVQFSKLIDFVLSRNILLLTSIPFSLRSIVQLFNCSICRGWNRAASSAGVIRYRTRHGWISENTRGTGRQPIVEVLAIGLAVRQGEGEVEVERQRGREIVFSSHFLFVLGAKGSYCSVCNGKHRRCCRAYRYFDVLSTCFTRVSSCLPPVTGMNHDCVCFYVDSSTLE